MTWTQLRMKDNWRGQLWRFSRMCPIGSKLGSEWHEPPTPMQWTFSSLRTFRCKLSARQELRGWKSDLVIYKLQIFLILLRTNWWTVMASCTHQHDYQEKECAATWNFKSININGIMACTIPLGYALKIFFLSTNFWYYNILSALEFLSFSSCIALASLFLYWALSAVWYTCSS